MNAFKTHLVYQIEALRTPRIALMLVVCPKNQLRNHMCISRPRGSNVACFSPEAR